MRRHLVGLLAAFFALAVAPALAETSPDLGVPFLASGQSQPHVTVNQALLVSTIQDKGVVDRGLNDPPSSPTAGDAYIIGSSPTGTWAGKANKLAIYYGGWKYLPGSDSGGSQIAIGARHEGMRVWVNDEDAYYRWSGSAWTIENSGGLLAANNLSDLANASTARTNLGVAIGTDVQAFDADLSAIAALSGTDNIYYRSASNTWSPVSIGTNLTFSAGTLSAAAGATLTVKDEGSNLTTAATSIDCVGAGIVCTNSTGAVTMTVSGGGGGGGGTEAFIFAVSDETSALATGTAKITFRMPYAFTVTAVRASLTTVSSSGTPTFDINENGSTILSTKLTIDASEKTSTTAAAAAVISDTALADDAEMTIDIDTAGTGATGAKVIIIGTQ